MYLALPGVRVPAHVPPALAPTLHISLTVKWTQHCTRQHLIAVKTDLCVADEVHVDRTAGRVVFEGATGEGVKVGGPGGSLALATRTLAEGRCDGNLS